VPEGSLEEEEEELEEIVLEGWAEEDDTPVPVGLDEETPVPDGVLETPVPVGLKLYDDELKPVPVGLMLWE